MVSLIPSRRGSDPDQGVAKLCFPFNFIHGVFSFAYLALSEPKGVSVGIDTAGCGEGRNVDRIDADVDDDGRRMHIH